MGYELGYGVKFCRSRYGVKFCRSCDDRDLFPIAASPMSSAMVSNFADRAMVSNFADRATIAISFPLLRLLSTEALHSTTTSVTIDFCFAVATMPTCIHRCVATSPFFGWWQMLGSQSTASACWLEGSLDLLGQGISSACDSL